MPLLFPVMVCALRRTLQGLFFAIAVLGTLALFPSGAASATISERAERAFRQAFKDSGVPGAQAAVVRDGRVRWHGVAGAIGVPGQSPRAKHRNRFVIASTTKPFVATMVMRLVERRRIDLADHVADFGIDVPNGRSITLEMLLSHTSGLPEYFDDAQVRRSMSDPNHRWTRDQVLAGIARGRPEYPPGARFKYTNSNYIVLGEIVERVTGRSVERNLRRVITGPAGLRTISFREDMDGHPIAHGTGGLFRGVARTDFYYRNGGKTPTDVIGPTWTDGGLAANATDIAGFADALFRGTIVRPRTVERMIPDSSEYGFGVFRTNSPELGEVYGHDGYYGGFGTEMTFDRRTRTAIAVNVNSDSLSFPATTIERKIREAIAAR